jgi:virginiamycin B lyase
MSVLVRSVALAAVLSAFGAAVSHAAITPTVTEFGDGSITLNSAPTGIAVGPDGNMYISEFSSTNGNRLARVAPDGTVTELPQFASPSVGVQNLVTGPDGKMYLTEASADSIGIFDPANPGTIVEHTTPTTGSNPHEITVGPDGNIWFTEADDNRIVEFSTADPATMHAFPSGGLGAVEPYGITSGPDGAIWFAERTGNAIGRLDPAAPNTVETFSTGISNLSRPRMIAAGPDGRLWFTQQGANAIGAIDPVSHVIQEFPITGTHVNPIGIARGPDGAMWFTENEGGDSEKGQIGRITPDGTITEYPLTPRDGESFSGPWNIIQGPDGNMWWTQIEDERVGRITTPPVATTGALTAVTETTATVAGTVNGHAQATSFHVDYGPTAAYGASTPEQSLGTITGSHAVAAALARAGAVDPLPLPSGRHQPHRLVLRGRRQLHERKSAGRARCVQAPNRQALAPRLQAAKALPLGTHRHDDQVRPGGGVAGQAALRAAAARAPQGPPLRGAQAGKEGQALYPQHQRRHADRQWAHRQQLPALPGPPQPAPDPEAGPLQAHADRDRERQEVKAAHGDLHRAAEKALGR